MGSAAQSTNKIANITGRDLAMTNGGCPTRAPVSTTPMIHAEMFLSRTPRKSVWMYPSKSASMFLGLNVRMFPTRNAETRIIRIVGVSHSKVVNKFIRRHPRGSVKAFLRRCVMVDMVMVNTIMSNQGSGELWPGRWKTMLKSSVELIVLLNLAYRKI